MPRDNPTSQSERGGAFQAVNHTVETGRLRLRRPAWNRLHELFELASDPDTTRWVGWPRHRALEDTRAFLAFADAEWERAPAGPLVIEERATGNFLGTTGLAFEEPLIASTGYVLRREAWGHGYANEALLGVVDLAQRLGVQRLFALCHPQHRASVRVLAKGGFEREGVLRRSTVFPNLAPEALQDACIYARIFDSANSVGGPVGPPGSRQGRA